MPIIVLMKAITARSSIWHELTVLQTIGAIVKEIGGDRVGLRLSPYNWDFNDCYEPDAEATVALNTYLLKELNKFNLAYAHIVSARAAGKCLEPTVAFAKDITHIL